MKPKFDLGEEVYIILYGSPIKGMVINIDSDEVNGDIFAVQRNLRSEQVGWYLDIDLIKCETPDEIFKDILNA